MDTQANKEHWDQLGGRYSEGWASLSQQELSRSERAFVVRHIPSSPGNRVLDVGVGNGRILECLLRHADVAEVYGIDIAPNMLEYCRDRLGDDPKLKQLELCDIATEPIAAPYDLQFISAVRVLKYVPDWWQVLQERLITQLAPGGVLVFSMPNKRSVKAASRSYAVEYHTTTTTELRDGLDRAGVEVLEIAGFSKFPDLIHRKCTAPWSSKLVIAGERAMMRPLGAARFATELFIAVRRPF
jgi:trans-aconitate methyltransferase